MGKCIKCGRKGLFFKVNSAGLCESCEMTVRLMANKNPSHREINNLQRLRGKSHGSDLVQATCVGYHCAECSKYINRVYSQNGNDKRFPRLPEYINNNADHCGITLYPFVYGVNYVRNIYTGKTLTNSQVIEYSNRPYTDSRPSQWKEGYRKLEAKENNKKNCINEYTAICKALPDIAPKSQSGYTKMKKNNSENYKKLAEKAKECGIIIRDFEKED